MKIKIISLGCSKNLMDSQTAMTFLVRNGHSFVDDPNDAEAILINTCAFINDAKDESINTILEMSDYKENKCQKLVVMGCLAQRYKEELETEIPEVDRFISITEYNHLEEILVEELGVVEKKNCDLVLATHPWSAYLRIADGCNNKCAFCAIPLIRGKYKSVPMEELLAQANQLLKLGVKELNLIAQDSTKYGYDLYHEFRLKDLLSELNKLDFHWIRILYMYPDELSDELIEHISKLDKVLPYFDIPVQHGSDRLLKSMRRAGDSKRIKEIIAKVRSTFSESTLRTTLIVGFPTEDEKDFEQLLDFVSDSKWDRLGAFKYSLEENTEAYNLSPRVPENTASERFDKLMTLQQGILEKESQRFLGTIQEVLIEGKDALRNIYQGRSKHHAPEGIDGKVVFNSTERLELGSFVNVKITKTKNYDWYGEAII